jgi:cation-transporting ATPase E
VLARYGASAASRTSTLDAIRSAFAGTPEQPAAEVPFASSRRWSAVTLGNDHYVLGAPELFTLNGLKERVDTESAEGRRVVAVGTTAADLADVKAEQGPPADLHPLGIVVIGERLRPNARETVAYLLAQGIELRVLSGDRPETVAAIARDAGVPEIGPPLDGGDLPGSQTALAKAVLGTSVIGRISPEGKKRVVEALTAEGKYVAMIGDGVNDVPALKASRLGIAQGSGSQMARSVADLVLVQNDFGSVPDMVVEGRKVLRNLTRVTKLFVTKSAFAVFLVVSIGLTPIAYPLLPRHLSLVAGLAIGIPGFFLALFSIPAGTAAGLGVLSSYLCVHEVLDKPLKESRTVAATVLLIVGLYLILALESTTARRGAWVGALCAVLGGLYVAVLVLPFGRHFYALALPGVLSWLAIIGGSTIAIAGLVLTDNRFIPGWALVRWAGVFGE